MSSRPRLAVAMAVRDEAGRYLRPVLEAVRPWADRLVILDDASADDSPAICREFADVFERNPEPLFGEEWRLRSKLWEMAASTGAEWIGVLDADEWFEPIVADELDAAMSSGAKVIAYRRYDLWDDLEHYRSDALWNAHERWTPFAVRLDPALSQAWPRKRQHVGNFPAGWANRTPVYQLQARMAHLGWVRPEERRRKHERYMRLDPEPDGRGRVVYASILDPRPHLEAWPGAPVFTPSHPRPKSPLRRPRLTVASPVRQAPKVLRAFLRALEEMDLCGRAVRWAFVDDNVDEASSRLLLDWSERHPGTDLVRAANAHDLNSYSRSGGDHHFWSPDAMARMGFIRTHLMARAIQHDSDHLFMVDSDVVLRPDTLRWLLAAGKPIVSEVMWTRYFSNQRYSHPNCWCWGDSNAWPGFAGESLPPLETYDRWKGWYRTLRRPGVYEVGGLGAVTLIERGALWDTYAHGGYNPLPRSGSYGEDRWFCGRALMLGYGLWVDTHAEPLHLYRDEDLRRLAGWRRRHARRAAAVSGEAAR